MACATPNRLGNLEYLELNMDYTKTLWNGMFMATTSKVEAVFSACLLPLTAVTELLVNIGFLLCNGVVALIHGANALVNQIAAVWNGYCGAAPANAEAAPRQQDTRVALRSPQVQLTRQQINPIACGTFSAHDLATLKAALQTVARRDNNRIQAVLQHLSYQIWFDPTTQTINIKENHTFERTLSMQIIEGGLIASITLDGVNQSSFPQDFEACMWPCFAKALEVSSSYENPDRIRVIRQGLIEVPDFHLEQLARLLDRGARPDISVRFLTPQLTEELGIDHGGLSRDYFDDLFKGLTLNKGDLRFSSRPDAIGKMPETELDLEEDNPRPPANNAREQSLFENMGKAMMYVYGSGGRLLTGKQFEDAVFHAVFSLTEAEIDTPFANLSNNTLLKMCRAICRARDTEQHIVNNLTLEDALDHCGRSLAPLHAIAKGIQAAKRRWDPAGAPINGQAFNERIQGSLDREAIANALNDAPDRSPPHYQQQVAWLRAWLRDPNTPLDHVRAFLKFATGSSSLLNGRQIGVAEQSFPYVPTLVGHSCFSRIDIAPVPCAYGNHNNRTRQAFIESLALALTEPGSYSMA